MQFLDLDVSHLWTFLVHPCLAQSQIWLWALYFSLPSKCNFLSHRRPSFVLDVLWVSGSCKWTVIRSLFSKAKVWRIWAILFDTGIMPSKVIIKMEFMCVRVPLFLQLISMWCSLIVSKDLRHLLYLQPISIFWINFTLSFQLFVFISSFFWQENSQAPDRLVMIEPNT